MKVEPGKIWAVEPGPGALAAVRARDAAEELSRRRSVYFQCNLPEPVEILVACATAWAAVAVAECAAAAEERERFPAYSVERVAVPPEAVADHVERSRWLRDLLDGLGEGVHSWRFEEPADGGQVLELVRRRL